MNEEQNSRIVDVRNTGEFEKLNDEELWQAYEMLRKQGWGPLHASVKAEIASNEISFRKQNKLNERTANLNTWALGVAIFALLLNVAQVIMQIRSKF